MNPLTGWLKSLVINIIDDPQITAWVDQRVTNAVQAAMVNETSTIINGVINGIKHLLPFPLGKEPTMTQPQGAEQSQGTPPPPAEAPQADAPAQQEQAQAAAPPPPVGGQPPQQPQDADSDLEAKLGADKSSIGTAASTLNELISVVERLPFVPSSLKTALHDLQTLLGFVSGL